MESEECSIPAGERVAGGAGEGADKIEEGAAGGSNGVANEGGDRAAREISEGTKEGVTGVVSEGAGAQVEYARYQSSLICCAGDSPLKRSSSPGSMTIPDSVSSISFVQMERTD